MRKHNRWKVSTCMSTPAEGDYFFMGVPELTTPDDVDLTSQTERVEWVSPGDIPLVSWLEGEGVELLDSLDLEIILQMNGGSGETGLDIKAQLSSTCAAAFISELGLSESPTNFWSLVDDFHKAEIWYNGSKIATLSYCHDQAYPTRHGLWYNGSLYWLDSPEAHFRSFVGAENTAVVAAITACNSAADWSTLAIYYYWGPRTH